MASTATIRLRIELQGTGENLNTWGQKLNTSALALLDTAIAGVTAFTLSGPKTLTSTNYVADEARSAVLHITGGTGGTITVPGVEKTYMVRNGASGVVTITAGGTTASIAAGDVGYVFTNGTDVYALKVTDYGSSALLSSFVPTLGNHLVNKTYADGLALSSALPGQSGNNGKFITTDGTTASWASITSTTVGLGNVENKSSATIRGELTSGNVTTALGYTPTSVVGLTGSQTPAAFRAGLGITIADVTGLQAALDLKSTIASPTFTGTPAAPTATPGTNTTQLATTEFVQTAVADSASGAVSFIYTPTGAYILGDRFPLVDTGNNVGAVSRLYATPLSKKMTADAMVAHLNAAVASSTFIIGIYAADGTDNGPGTLIAQSGTISGNTTGTIVSTLAGDQAITEPVWLVIQTGATAPSFAPGSASGGDVNLNKDWPQTSLSALVKEAGFYFNRTFAVLPGTFPGTARTGAVTSNLPVMALRQT